MLLLMLLQRCEIEKGQVRRSGVGLCKRHKQRFEWSEKKLHAGDQR